MVVTTIGNFLLSFIPTFYLYNPEPFRWSYHFCIYILSPSCGRCCCLYYTFPVGKRKWLHVRRCPCFKWKVKGIGLRGCLKAVDENFGGFLSFLSSECRRITWILHVLHIYKKKILSYNITRIDRYFFRKFLLFFWIFSNLYKQNTRTHIFLLIKVRQFTFHKSDYTCLTRRDVVQFRICFVINRDREGQGM